MRKRDAVMLLLPIVLPACTLDQTNRERLRLLSIEECAEQSAGNGPFAGAKSPQLIRKECEQTLAWDQEYQRILHRKSSQHTKLTAPGEQQYFDENAWRLVTERIRERDYPTVLSPEEEVARAAALNATQSQPEDNSAARVYEPRLLPVSPYLMGKKDLERADAVISDLIQEHFADKKVHRALAVLRTIVVEERRKKDRL